MTVAIREHSQLLMSSISFVGKSTGVPFETVAHLLGILIVGPVIRASFLPIYRADDTQMPRSTMARLNMFFYDLKGSDSDHNCILNGRPMFLGLANLTGPAN